MKKRNSFFRWIPFVFWIIIVYILLTLPGKDFGNFEFKIPNLDKLVHMSLFGGFVFWFGFAVFTLDFQQTRKRIIIATICSCLFGIAMEYVQKYCTQHTRDFSYGDMVADCLGAFIGFQVVRFIIKKIHVNDKNKLDLDTKNTDE